MRPYGVWVVISPFNFPAALTGGPAAAALVAGNTLVMKPATDTPWTARLLAECLRDAGLPAGVFNYVTGPGCTLGQALIDNPGVDGITFTGSYEVGMQIYRDYSPGQVHPPHHPGAGRQEPRHRFPQRRSGNRRAGDRALGLRAAGAEMFGLLARLRRRRRFIRTCWQDPGAHLPVEGRRSHPARGDLQGRSSTGLPTGITRPLSMKIREAGKILAGGHHLTEGDLAEGFFCAPTLCRAAPRSPPVEAGDVPAHQHHCRGIRPSRGHALANDVDYGLTAGFYGSETEAEWFFDNIEAGVTYANRPQGATTGAWPGYQPFGGWKGSGSTGKNAGGLYYLPLYLHEQIQNRVTKG